MKNKKKAVTEQRHTPAKDAPGQWTAKPIDTATLKRGDQFTYESGLGIEQQGRHATAVYVGGMDEGEGIRHNFDPYITEPGKPPIPFGHMSMLEGRDIGKGIHPVFNLTPIGKGHPAWIDNPDLSMGNMLDALNELGQIEREGGEVTGAALINLIAKHAPKGMAQEIGALAALAAVPPNGMPRLDPIGAAVNGTRGGTRPTRPRRSCTCGSPIASDGWCTNPHCPRSQGIR